jgi:hypothetical protein
MHIECAAQSRKDLRDRAITRFYSDGLRAAANTHFRECRRRCSCQSAAHQDRSQDGRIERTDDAYREDCEARQFYSPAGAGDPVAAVRVYLSSTSPPLIFARTISRGTTLMKSTNAATVAPQLRTQAVSPSNEAKRDGSLVTLTVHSILVHLVIQFCYRVVLA